MRLTSTLAVLLFGSPAFAQVYSWTDHDGSKHYTNTRESIPKGVQVDELVPPDPPDTAAPAPATPLNHETRIWLSAPSSVPKPRIETIPANERERKILEGIKPGARRAADAQIYDVANWPAFLHLAQTSPDPDVVTAALSALWDECSPNPEAGATFNGKPYQRVKCSDEAYRTAL